MKKHFHPAAFCQEHGLFEATALSFGGGATVIGCVQNCPHPQCGRLCEIIPGKYDDTPSGLNILLDKSISPAALAAIRRLAEQLQQGKISIEEAKTEAAKISPKAANLFDIANWSEQTKGHIVAAIIGAVAIVSAAKLASSPSQNITIQPVIERVIDKRDLPPPTMNRQQRRYKERQVSSSDRARRKNLRNRSAENYSSLDLR